MAGVLLSDIDGTLVDSNALHAEAWRRAFEHYGVQLGFDELWRQIGKGGDQLIPFFLSGEERKRLAGPIQEYRKQLFRREYLPRVSAFPAAQALLQQLHARGMRIAFATSSEAAEVAIYRQRIGVEEGIVEEASSSADVEHSKPSPDIFAAALAKVGVKACEAVALGDTPYDAQAAGALGIPVIGLTCGGWKRSDLLEAGCREVYTGCAELLDRLTASSLAA